MIDFQKEAPSKLGLNLRRTLGKNRQAGVLDGRCRQRALRVDSRSSSETPLFPRGDWRFFDDQRRRAEAADLPSLGAPAAAETDASSGDRAGQ